MISSDEVDMRLKYNFIQHFYIADKETYEAILCECLNKSNKMIDLLGGEFTPISKQSEGQADVVAKKSQYELDFKMMISESLKEYQVHSEPIIEEITRGVKISCNPEPLKKKILLIWNCCRNLTAERLQELRQENDMEGKAVVHFFDKVINKKKHILLFIPVYFSTVEEELKPSEQFDAIFMELSITTQYIYEYREQNCKGYDTFIAYIANILPKNEKFFVFAQFTRGGLVYIDKVAMSSLAKILKLKEENPHF